MSLRPNGVGSGLLGLAAFFAFSIGTAHAAVIYQVTVNTSSLNGVNGIIDLQFNPGGVTSQAATALVTSFSGATLGNVVPPVIGPVTGTLPTDDLLFQNSANTDYAHEILFTNSFQFRVAFDGPALTAPNDGPAGTSFGLFLYDQSFSPLITLDALIAQIDINPNGTLTTTGFPIGASVASFQIVNESPIPEPSTLTSMLLAGSALALFIRKRSAKVPRFP